MKKVFLVVALIFTLLIPAGCNLQWVDTTWSFEKAIISLPNGEVITGEVTKWMDFENSDQIQVEIDGKVYLTHISNVVLISE